jgi:hypothetical protein
MESAIASAAYDMAAAAALSPDLRVRRPARALLHSLRAPLSAPAPELPALEHLTPCPQPWHHQSTHNTQLRMCKKIAQLTKVRPGQL